jgi:hypothetical protein
MSQTSPRPTLAHAYAGYDQQFREHLAAEIIKTITRESVVSDQHTLALRTAETSEALGDVLATMLALDPNNSTPSALRETCELLAKKLRHTVAQMRAEGMGDFLGASQFTGHA